MPRFAASAPSHSFGSGFDSVPLRDAFEDFRTWWDRNCLIASAAPRPAQPPQQPPQQTPEPGKLPLAA